MSPASNPYIVGPPIGGENGFFGRDEIIREIEQLLLYPNKNSVILYGQRYSGKTSLLLQLERRLPRPPFFTVYFDLADKALLPVHQVLFEMAVKAADKAGMQPPAADMFHDNPDAFHEQFLPVLYQQLGPQQQPIYLLDEYDPVATKEADLPPNATVRALDEYLYGLLTSQSYIDFVFAAGRRMAELSQVVNSSYRADLARFVPVLNPDQARALITQPGAPAYNSAAIDQILALTRGHPFFTQRVCHALFEQAMRQSPQKPRVKVSDIEAIMPVLLDQGSGAEARIWHSMPYPEQLTLAAIAAQITKPGDIVTEAAISNAFSQVRIPPSLDGLGLAPEYLVDWQMLAQSGNGYTFFIDYFRRWAARHRPLEVVKKSGAGAAISSVAAAVSADTGPSPNIVQTEVGSRATETSQPQAVGAKSRNSLWLTIGAAILLLLLLCAGWLLWGRGDSGLLPQEATAAAQLTATQAALNASAAADSEATEISKTTSPSSSATPTGSNSGATSTVTETATASAIATEQLAGQNAATATAASMATEAAIATVNAATATNPEATPTPTPIITASPASVTPSGTPTVSGNVLIETAPEFRSLLEAAATDFVKQHPEIAVTIEDNSDQAGLESVQQGNSNLALLSRALTPEETANLENVQVIDLPPQKAAAVIMHVLVATNDLTTEQVRDIFSGTITNWSQLGAGDAPIVKVVPPTSSPARLTFEQQIMGDVPLSTDAIETATDGHVRNYVASHPYAIGFATIDTVLQNTVLEQAPTGSWVEFDTALLEVRASALDGIAPTVDNIYNGLYRLAQPLKLVAQDPPDTVTQTLLEFLLSPAGRRLFESQGTSINE